MTINTACYKIVKLSAHYHCRLYYIVGDSNLIAMFSIDDFGIRDAIDEISVWGCNSMKILKVSSLVCCSFAS